ncbi:hypothetical protein P2Q00_00680 [Streptomyces coacervatus]|nr:hypothetical protein [Streptomyces coacervatus]MDF2263961.1 hypothetical protein [Streptomyces coacervatus]
MARGQARTCSTNVVRERLFLSQKYRRTRSRTLVHLVRERR